MDSTKIKDIYTEIISTRNYARAAGLYFWAELRADESFHIWLNEGSDPRYGKTIENVTDNSVAALNALSYVKGYCARYVVERQEEEVREQEVEFGELTPVKQEV